MKIDLLLPFLFMGLASCATKNAKVTSEIAIEDLKLNEVVHDSLITKQVKEIERIHKIFSEVNSSSLEETINNFKRDQHPDKEIAVWLKMADAYEHLTLNRNFQIDQNKKDEAYQLILLRSMMTEEEVIEKSKFTYLTSDEVKEIFGYYTDPPDLLRVQEIAEAFKNLPTLGERVGKKPAHNIKSCQQSL